MPPLSPHTQNSRQPQPLPPQLTGRTAVGVPGQGGLIRRGLAGMARSSSTGYLLGLGFVDEEGDALTISQSGVRTRSYRRGGIVYVCFCAYVCWMWRRP